MRETDKAGAVPAARGIFIIFVNKDRKGTRRLVLFL